MTTEPEFDLGGPLPTGRTAIEASAGAGKTFTLAGLATRFVAEAGVPASELLVVTFTRAAAAELRDRIRSRIADGAAALASPAALASDDAVLRALAETEVEIRRRRLEQAISEFDTATITTIHGFAQQMLAALGSASPGDLDATLVDDARELVTQACADTLARVAVEQPDAAGALPRADVLASLAAGVLGNPGIAVVPLPGVESSPRAALWRRVVDEVVDLVERRRRLAGTLSFDDLLTQLEGALRASPAARAMLRRRFAVVLVDEFQDTDPVQWGIFSQLAGDGDEEGARLVLVGDPKQAIYAFRGADVHTYLAATSSPGTRRSTLVTNWRSDAALLGATGRLLSGATFGDARIAYPQPRAAAGHETTRVTTGAGTVRPALQLRLATGPGIRRTSAGLVESASAEDAIREDLVRYVGELLDDAWLPARGDGAARRPVRPSDVAVLVGTHVESRQVHGALRERGIPAIVARGGSVLESRAAMQWRWILTALARPGDPASARGAALSWWFGWPAERVASADDDDLADVHEQLFEWGRDLASHGTVDLCARVVAESGVVARVLATPDGDRDVTDLDHVAALLQARATHSRPTAGGLLAALDELGAVRPTGPEDDVTSRRVESEDDAVQIMTVYVAKGLEFPIVCVPTLWRGSLATARRVVYHDPEGGRRTIDVAPAEAWPDRSAHEQRRDLAGAEARGENLRLLYVALTRARHETAVWWAHAKDSDLTGLSRVLFARDACGIDPARFAGARVPLPDDADAAPLVARALGSSEDISVAAIGRDRTRAARRGPRATPTAPRPLAIATLARELDRSQRRWSFSAIVEREPASWVDPADESLGDARAADEHAGDDEIPLDDSAGSDLPLGAVPGGTEFGTLVHEVLERVDFAAEDLDAELCVVVEERLSRSSWPVDRDELVRGLRAAIETPLGALLGGRRLRDFARADRLDELSFEMHLGGAGHHPSERDVGALALHHLERTDPLRGWAERLAAGPFSVELAGHLTGSIDAVFRLGGSGGDASAARYVLADYKTNTLGPRTRLPRSADYTPAGLVAAMDEHHYPLQALLYAVALHRYLRWRVRRYDPATHLAGAAYLFVRGMSGASTPATDGVARGVLVWAIPPRLVSDLSDLFDGRLVAVGEQR